MKLFVLLLLGSLNLHAADSLKANFDPRWTGVSSKSALLLGTEYATFSAPSRTLSGVGFNLGYHYLLGSHLSLKGNISQGLNTSESFSFLYTGFGANINYALLGSWAQDDDQVEWRGRPVITVKNKKETIWGVNFGLEQLLFGGSSSVYNAPGMSAGIFSKFEIWNQEFLGSLAYGAYTSSGASITGITLKLQFLLNGK